MARGPGPRDETLEPLLHGALVSAGMPARYYDWCDGLRAASRHDPGADDYRPSRAAQREAWASTGLAFNRSGFVTARLPVGDLEVTLSAIGSRSGPLFDLCPGLRRADGSHLTAPLHVFCGDLLQARGEPLREPAYPRPGVATDEQLRWLVDRCADLMADVAAYVRESPVQGR